MSRPRPAEYRLEPGAYYFGTVSEFPFIAPALASDGCLDGPRANVMPAHHDDELGVPVWEETEFALPAIMIA